MSRTPLTRERILTAAVRLVDHRGAEALTMRALAAELRVEAMSLYHHVTDKADVLDGVTERVLGEMDIKGATAGTWQKRIRALAHAFRAVALAHPRSFTLVLTRQLAAPAGLRPTDAGLAVLARAGFAKAQAVHVLRAFSAFLTGSLMRELGASPTFSGRSPRAAAARRAQLAASGFPSIAGAAEHLAVCRHEEEYDFGIDLLLRALGPMRGRRAPRSSAMRPSAAMRPR